MPLWRGAPRGTEEDRLLLRRLEIQPLGNNAYMVREGKVESEEVIKDFNRTVIQLGEDLHKPVIATGDVHFTEPEDAIYRSVLQAGNGFKDADNQPPLFYRTTEDMLKQFSYLPKEKAYEIVVTNPRKIAATIDNNVRAIPRGTYPPSIEGAEQQLRDATWEHAKRDYGDPLPKIVEDRLKRSWTPSAATATRFCTSLPSSWWPTPTRAAIRWAAVVGGLVGRGPLLRHFGGQQPAAPLPLPCKYSEFITDGSVDDGFDLPDKDRWRWTATTSP